YGVFRVMPDADPANYVRGQYDGYQAIEGVAAGSSTETYAALRLEIENWRWSGVPFFIRTGKCLPVTQTEVRLVFRPPPPPRVRATRPPSAAARLRRPGAPSRARPADHPARPLDRHPHARPGAARRGRRAR